MMASTDPSEPPVRAEYVREVSRSEVMVIQLWRRGSGWVRVEFTRKTDKSGVLRRMNPGLWTYTVVVSDKHAWHTGGRLVAGGGISPRMHRKMQNAILSA